MVPGQSLPEWEVLLLSVLALSSRFDGQLLQIFQLAQFHTFSTRSVESF